MSRNRSADGGKVKADMILVCGKVVTHPTYTGFAFFACGDTMPEILGQSRTSTMKLKRENNHRRPLDILIEAEIEAKVKANRPWIGMRDANAWVIEITQNRKTLFAALHLQRPRSLHTQFRRSSAISLPKLITMGCSAT